MTKTAKRDLVNTPILSVNQWKKAYLPQMYIDEQLDTAMDHSHVGAVLANRVLSQVKPSTRRPR